MSVGRRGIFLETIRARVIGDALEQSGAKRLARARPKLEEVIANLERVKGRSWAEIRDRHGDDGRNLVLHVAWGMRLRELAVAVEMSDYSAVSIAIRR